jgi:hypothetical protein
MVIASARQILLNRQHAQANQPCAICAGGRRTLKRLHLLTLMMLFSAGALTGCQGQDQPPPDLVGAVPAPPEVTLTITDSFLQSPDTLAEGWTTFRLVNEGNELHMAMLVRLDDGRSPEEFIEVYSEAIRTDGPRPEWAQRVGGPGAAAPGGTSNATQYLEPGRYMLLDIMDLGGGVPNFMREQGLGQSFVVEAPTDLAALPRPPAADVDIRLVDYAFSMEAPLSPGRQTIRVYNTGSQPHEIGIVQMAPGTTIGELLAWIETPEGPPPMAGTAGGVASIAPDREAFFEVDLEAGDYALLCFVTAPDGRTHADHGMYQHIRVR